MERLGDTVEFGELLLGLLRLDEWFVWVRPAFAGAGVIVGASRGDLRVTVEGDTKAAVAAELFTRAVALRQEERRAQEAAA